MVKEVKVVIEFCGVCNFTRQCNDLKSYLNNVCPAADVSCQKSASRGAFEVTINQQKVHSKLQTIAFPVYEDVAKQVKNCIEGKEVKVVREQKITDCCIS